MEDIILVTGCHLTRSFVNVAFSKSQNDVQVTFGVCAGDSKAEIAWRFSREPIHGAMVKYGPDGDNLPENQCIFVRGFRASRPLRILPVKIEGTAEPTADSDPPPDEHLISVPSSSGDPLHVLLQYLAEKEPSCDMALVHDDDLGCISEASLRSLQPDAFMGHLRDSQPQTYCHQSFDHEGSSKAGARVRIAMFEREYKSSPPEETTLSSSGASIASCAPSLGPRSSLTDMHGVGSLLPDRSLLPPAAVTPVASSSFAQPSEEALSSTVVRICMRCPLLI
ncbi:hypothetical protein BC826DRAFT_257847 [Russula brevipes]|nr:hypothetical protein BC826DRAFT_257847 [Russula brevipes]